MKRAILIVTFSLWSAGAGDVSTAGDSREHAVTSAPAEGATGRKAGRPRESSPGTGREGTAARRRTDRARPGTASANEAPLPPERIEEVLSFARDYFPAIAQRLERLRRERPQEFQRMCRKVRARLLPLMEMKKSDRALAQKMIEEHRARMAVMQTAEQYRRAESSAKRERLATELQQRLREQFERHQERARLEIAQLRRRLDEQEQRLVERESRREELVQRELERLVGDEAAEQAKDQE